MTKKYEIGKMDLRDNLVEKLFSHRFVPNYVGAFVVLSIIAQLSGIKLLLAQIGPIISAIMFIVAGVFYAIGQLMPPQAKAGFHITAINILIGAVVVAALSVASTSLATASSHLLSNITTTNATNPTP